uniref:Uncharacterized protein n=1 Tax=Physcomitrium patens TaxID=3218 RepID=A0A2K1KQ86_PHYPA|nr:hypothetical protein PHYPA_006834 [Physcomitrium patens]
MRSLEELWNAGKGPLGMRTPGVRGCAISIFAPECVDFDSPSPSTLRGSQRHFSRKKPMKNSVDFHVLIEVFFFFFFFFFCREDTCENNVFACGPSTQMSSRWSGFRDNAVKARNRGKFSEPGF